MANYILPYRRFTIFKDQVLGHGSYGAVYKARCDQLTCAAKVLHPTIADAYDPGAGKILQRFQQECDFLNHIRHPHIVQYLGVCQDPESKLPVLLMELLDNSLTKMLESSPYPIPYHIQVDLCSDVSFAVAYLHSNGIIHRDLSGNNVLVIAGRRAKVTDFGMSKLTRAERHFTPLTMCPGTLGYMSPESLIEPPRYSEKLDVFSQGVIMIQVCTRQFPDPGPAIKEVEDPRSPTGSMQVPVLEPERRKKHIDLINPTHPLLLVGLSCLEYREKDRPAAEELCQRLATLKESQEYIESTQHLTSVTNETLQQERDELARQVEEKNKQISIKDEQWQRDITIKDQVIAAKDLQITRMNEELASSHCEIQGLQVQLHELNQKLVSTEQVFQETNQQLQKHISDLQKPHEELSHQQLKKLLGPQQSNEVELKFTWRDRGKAPFVDFNQGMVVDGNVAYFSSNRKVYSFDSSTGKWNTRLPECPYWWGSLAIVQNFITIIGGWITSDQKTTNKLVSLTKKEEGGSWNVKFPPMPTSRIYILQQTPITTTS